MFNVCMCVHTHTSHTHARADPTSIVLSAAFKKERGCERFKCCGSVNSQQINHSTLKSHSTHIAPCLLSFYVFSFPLF